MSRSPNIFLLGPSIGPEDRFTSHWSYLLDNHPQLGPRVLDRIADWTGLPRSPYRSATDHPLLTFESRPDFAIHAEDYDVLCEHKLDSDIGPAQLQRYCALARSSPRPTYVILVGKSPLQILDSVFRLEAYRWPRLQAQRGEECRHFLWEDFYDLVRAEPGRLAADFLVYMVELGLEPWKWSSIGDPFTDGEAKAQFRRLWRNILPRYRRPGSLVKQDPLETGFQYQKPMPGIHLIWVWAVSRDRPAGGSPRARPSDGGASVSAARRD